MTREREIRIAGPCRLEGRIWPGDGKSRRGVVVAHPHPLYGGDMNNPVVTTVGESFAAAGWTGLAFNFRGVGRSAGEYGGGRGEIDDLLAARDFLVELGVEEIVLAGYSFGAWVIALAAAAGRLGCEGLVLVSPPVAMLEFPADLKLGGLRRVITGADDEIAPPELTGRLAAGWNPAAPLHVIPGCDHFYGGCLERLAQLVSSG